MCRDRLGRDRGKPYNKQLVKKFATSTTRGEHKKNKLKLWNSSNSQAVISRNARRRRPWATNPPGKYFLESGRTMLQARKRQGGQDPQLLINKTHTRCSLLGIATRPVAILSPTTRRMETTKEFKGRGLLGRVQELLARSIITKGQHLDHWLELKLKLNYII